MRVGITWCSWTMLTDMRTSTSVERLATLRRSPGALAIAHARIMGKLGGGWSSYMNSVMPLQTLLAEPSGKLATGPFSLLAAYAEALESHGVETKMLDAGCSHALGRSPAMG